MKCKYKIFAAAALLLASCNDYLDKSPMSQVAEDKYLTSDKQLDSYALDRYPELYDHNKVGGNNSLLMSDFATDDKTSDRCSQIALYSEGGSGVSIPASGGLWNFIKVRKCNYFFDRVLPRYEAGSITGDPAKVKHYIGEMYFFRAYEYFNLYRELGDMPICEHIPEMDMDALIAESIRRPRNEVARFILSDLDKAIDLLMEVSPDGKKNRLNKNAARLFKSRVALFEGSWLHNFKGTAFVPGGEGWPGEATYPSYAYPAGDIDAEAKWFFEQAMAASEVVADNVPLTQQNTFKVLQQNNSPGDKLYQEGDSEPNPYYDMFADNDMSGYSEIIVWKDYDTSLGVKHGSGCASVFGNYFYGTTKGFVESFLMRNGLPIYADGSGYAGDNSTYDVVKERDTRLQLFLKVPGQKNRLTNTTFNPQYDYIEDTPYVGASVNGYTTGYALRKYGPHDGRQYVATICDTGCPLFRGSEAYLNYMEASYMATGSINAKAKNYWEQLRDRAGVDIDFNKTIAATVMTEEAKGDWGAYSAGVLVDPTLYNIRRERRNELMSENFRMADLRRWRSMDQMQENPYIIQGFKLWNSDMSDWDFHGVLCEYPDPKANVSSKADGDYLCPYRVNDLNSNFNGFTWSMAHYLTPIAANHFIITGGDASTMYQNPGWSKTSGSNAEF